MQSPPRLERPLLLSAAALFILSTSLVWIASISARSLPAWGGILDVIVAFAIAVLLFYVYSLRILPSSEHYRLSLMAAAYLVPLALIVMWLLRDMLDFNILLPGLAWRTYVFFMILPPCLSLWNTRTPHA